MKTICGILVLVAAGLFAGCDRMDMGMGMGRSTTPPVAATPAVEPRYNSPPRVNPPVVVREESNESAVETALAWAQKHMEVSAKLAASEKENRALTEKNQALAQQVEASKGQLAAAQKELNEANAMLKELEGRLAKWQENVLGYRQEMREAQKAQMEALGRVIKLLGGEASAVAAGKEGAHAVP